MASVPTPDYETLVEAARLGARPGAAPRAGERAGRASADGAYLTGRIV